MEWAKMKNQRYIAFSPLYQKIKSTIVIYDAYLQKTILHTRLRNFWLCLRIIYFYIRKAVPVASKKTAPTIIFFLLK